MKTRKLVYSAILVVLLTSFVVFGTGAQAMNGSGWWTSANVQRIGSGTAGSVEVVMEAYPPAGTTGGPYACGSKSLASFGSGATFYTHQDCTLPSGSFQGSAVLYSEDQMAAIAQTLNIKYGGWAPGDTPYGRAVAAYAGLSAPATTVRFPLYKNNHNGEQTTFYVQNTDGSNPTNITAVFRPCSNIGTGSACLGYGKVYTYTYSNLPSNQMVVFDATLARAADNSTIPAGNNSYGSLVVTSSAGNIAGVVMEHNKTASPATYLKSNEGFAPSDYDTTLYAPQIKWNYPYPSTVAGRTCQQKWSSLMVQNADDVAVNITVTYTINGVYGTDTSRVGDVVTDKATNVQPGETAFFMAYQQGARGLLTEGDLASAKIVATGDVVGIVSEETYWTCSNADLKDAASWPAIPDNRASTRISVPFYKQEWNGKFQGIVVQNVGGGNATYNLTFTTIGAQNTGVTAGDVVKITHTDQVLAGGAKTFVMPCAPGNTSNLSNLTGDDADIAAMCGGATTFKTGSYAAVVIESNEPIVAVVAEEKGWWAAASQVGDGHSEDASIFTAIPLSAD